MDAILHISRLLVLDFQKKKILGQDRFQTGSKSTLHTHNPKLKIFKLLVTVYILKPAFFFVHNKHNLFYFKSIFLRVSDCQIRQFFGSELTKFCLRLAPPKKKDTHILLLSYFDSSHSNFPTSDFVLKTPKNTHTHTHTHI